MHNFTNPTPERKRSGRPAAWLGLLLLAAGLLVLGSDRWPADATKPVAWHVPASPRAAQNATLRIASYNIHGGKGADGRLDLSRIARDLNEVDVAGLYEVRSFFGSTFPDQAADLGQQLGLRSLYLGTERRWGRDHFGNAILAAVEIDQVQRIPLIGTRGKAFRQAVLFDVPCGDQTVHVLMAHVDREQDRVPQLKSVLRLFDSLAPPALLMGDLNSGPNDPELRRLLAQPGVTSVLQEHLKETAPADHIDWIITRGLECLHAEFEHTGASDHPVLRAELKVPEQ